MTTTCPSQGELMLLALGETAGAATDERIATHLRACAACREAAAGFADVAPAVRRTSRLPSPMGASCLDELAIAALAEGSAGPAERAAALAHLPECGACRAQLAEVCALLRDAGVAAALGQLAPTRVARPRTVARAGLLASLAAAAAAFAVLGPRATTPSAGDLLLRDEAVAPAASPSAIAPRGTVRSARVFRWSSAPGADEYRVRVFGADGTVLWEQQTADTAAAMPASHELPPGVRLLWKVEARTAFDRWVGSGLAEFRVAGDGPRP